MKAILTLLATWLAALVLAVPASAADRYIPFVTDFPRPAAAEPYVPFVTDFPSGVTQDPPALLAADVRDGFDWLDAAYGSVAGFALGALAAATLLLLRRRASFSTASLRL